MADAVVYGTIFAGILTVFVLYFWRINKKATKTTYRPSREELLNKRIVRFKDEAKTSKSKTLPKESFVEEEENVGRRRNCNQVDNNGRKKLSPKPLKRKRLIQVKNKVFLSPDQLNSSIPHEPPNTRPLKSLEELLSWRPGFDEFSVSHIALKSSTTDSNKPRTLVCHDMKGGYIEDRFVQGFCSNTCYTFHHWQLIDSFCYFSHNFVTIPPVGWTNAAHTNGVKVLGTIITEWKDGAKLCAEIFESRDRIERVVDALVDMSEYYGFDGWLVNIENEIIPLQVDNVVFFMKTLTRKMHERIVHAGVIWYDSVIYTGKLKWQNKLCVENRVFFDACDGIFLNYNWSISDLQHSLYVSGAERQKDVYVGVDVFGRGCFGGGGWNTYKALQVIREKVMSAAIFAPGWVMEKFGTEEFITNNSKFWELLTNYLYPHVVSSLPLVTTFCQGYGEGVYMDGQLVKKMKWTNLSTQSLQPTFSSNFYQLGPKNGMDISQILNTTSNGYNGGGCMLINGRVSTMEKQTRTVFRLFKTDTSLDASDEITVTFTWMSSTDRVKLFLLLLFDDVPNYVVFTPQASEKQKTTAVAPCSSYFVPRGQEENYVFVKASNKDSPGQFRHENNTTWIENNWTTDVFRYIPDKNRHLCELRVALVSNIDEHANKADSGEFEVHLGEIKIVRSLDMLKAIATPRNLRCRDISIKPNDINDSLLQITFTLSWDFVIDDRHAQPQCFDIFYDGSCDQVNGPDCSTDEVSTKYGTLLGRAYVCSYYIAELDVPKVCKSPILMTVQSVDFAGRRQIPDADGVIQLTW